jgi:hypothetical protein
MKNHIKALAVLAAVALAASVQAGVTETDGLGTSWIGTPSFNTYANPTPLNNPNGAYSVEGNYGTGGSGGFGGLAQGFRLTSGGTLDNIQISLAGAANTFNVFLYDFGPFSSYVQAGSATVWPAAIGGTAVNLLSSGLSFTYNGGAGGALNIAKVQFSGADAVSLLANEYYVFAIEPTTSAATQWSRGGGSTTGLYGQGYRLNQFTAAPGQYGAINGGVREFGLAVTVPEPSTFAFLGLGLAALLIRRKA